MGEHYRHEYKYVCSIAQIQILQARMKGILNLDKHVGTEGIYNIRSLYFDDIYDTCFWENEEGTDPREKFRIRIYNHQSQRISLELKKKVCGMTQKLSCPLTEEQCRMLMQGKIPDTDSTTPALLTKLCLQMKTRLLKPAIIVEYDRIPYVCANGNVRITFDKNIRSSNHVTSFLEDTIPERLIMPEGQHILEVKWDEYLLDYIYQILQLGNLKQTNFSKYYLCRKFTTNGGKKI